MLFTTATFAVLFLPLALAGYFAIGRRSPSAAAAWLFVASVFFYGWWMPELTFLLLGSIVANFSVGGWIARHRRAGRRIGPWPTSSIGLVVGVAFNLTLLGYFKYANFFVDNLNALLGLDWHLARIVLPIGISFYSFTQIAFLVDTWHGKVDEYRPVHYGLFVTYFPHLVAGPVLHHAQMMPQFADRSVYRFDSANFLAGVAIFGMGLLKKVVLADGVAPYADAVFGPSDLGMPASPQEAWLAALAYTFQLYFDFSGYSDMAIGLSWMFNIRLPFNFDSPYRARSIAEFWRRWHISLSTFLRDYLYIALGGNRHGSMRRYVNLAVTMVLGGLWHGASWVFVVWGALHGAYLMINHGFRAVCARVGWEPFPDRHRWSSIPAWAITMLAVVVAWVFFRSHTLEGAARLIRAMAGGVAVASDGDVNLWNAGLRSATGWIWCGFLASIALVLPNSNVVGDRIRRGFQRSETFRIVGGAAALCLSLFLVLLNTARESASAFIYFNF